MRKFGVIALRHFSARNAVTGRTANSQLVRGKAEGRSQHTQAVFDAAFEVDGRSIFKVLGGAGNFADLETEHDGLRNHLVVEDKIIGVLKQWQRLQKLF